MDLGDGKEMVRHFHPEKTFSVTKKEHFTMNERKVPK
jgi:hypothetical protein